ncbi:hypothetical protein CYMTET_35195 [Cymbomonas tetramitiformis]|uniref:Uncharacterized protein n=1 Tax=Cymbomonas tetramitiformis TaxID=36881 RepID=A0AAE0KP54_9CHLO|nr:hypothetical protein CYMTET_35195 [Cymbomonas tetramitiformis]
MPGSSEVEPAGAGAAAAGGERDLSSDGGSGSDELPQEEDQFGDLSALEGELLWLDLGETEDVGGARQGDEKQDDDRWWRGLVPTSFVPVWDVAGLPLRREGQPAPGDATFQVFPMPVSEHSPELWALLEGSRVRVSHRWPALREDILRRATKEHFEATGTAEHERAQYVQECHDAGVAVPLLTERAHIVAAAFAGWHDVEFLVRGAVCGVGWPYKPVEMAEPFRVPNYVGSEHMEAMGKEIANELLEKRIFQAGDRLPLGVSALGMVEKIWNGKVKYRPVWDYSRPATVGVNDRIHLEHDKFSSVRDA